MRRLALHNRTLRRSHLSMCWACGSRHGSRARRNVPMSPTQTAARSVQSLWGAVGYCITHAFSSDRRLLIFMGVAFLFLHIRSAIPFPRLDLYTSLEASRRHPTDNCWYTASCLCAQQTLSRPTLKTVTEVSLTSSGCGVLVGASMNL